MFMFGIQSTGEHLRQFEFSAPTTESMMLLPGNRAVVLGAAYSAESNAVQVRDLQTGEPLALLHGHESSVYRLAYSQGVLASASRDKTIRLWEPETFKQIGKLEGHEDEVKSIAFSPDGQWLASCDWPAVCGFGTSNRNASPAISPARIWNVIGEFFT